MHYPGRKNNIIVCSVCDGALNNQFSPYVYYSPFSTFKSSLIAWVIIHSSTNVYEVKEIMDFGSLVMTVLCASNFSLDMKVPFLKIWLFIISQDSEFVYLVYNLASRLVFSDFVGPSPTKAWWHWWISVVTLCVNFWITR